MRVQNRSARSRVDKEFDTPEWSQPIQAYEGANYGSRSGTDTKAGWRAHPASNR